MLRTEQSKGSIPAKHKLVWMKTDYLDALPIAGFNLEFENQTLMRQR